MAQRYPTFNLDICPEFCKFFNTLLKSIYENPHQNRASIGWIQNSFESQNFPIKLFTRFFWTQDVFEPSHFVTIAQDGS